MSDVIVKVRSLTKVYDNKKVVSGISFDIKRGEVFGILGPNGAGKTTTLEMIETLRPIDGGSIMVDGLDVSKDSKRVKYIIGVQPQSPAFMDKIKLTEHLEQLASAYGERIDAKHLLDEVNFLD